MTSSPNSPPEPAAAPAPTLPDRAPLWHSDILASAFARAFAPMPTQLLPDWADDNVWLENKVAAESGPYRSAKTPHTRRLQILGQTPVMYCYDVTAGVWLPVRVTEINEMKSSQSGFTEGVLNIIRFRANHRPCNVIYTVDTRETAADISTRLLPSLQKLDNSIFTGDDDDVGTFTMRLRCMDIWFQGSFSAGKFASKQAPLVIADEMEEHGVQTKDTSTGTNLKSRKKCADDGLQINLCKPKKNKGPIHKAFLRGNQEEFHIACPHCGYRQWLTFFPEERDVPFSPELDEIRDEQTGEIVATLPRPLPLGEIRKVTTGQIKFSHCKDLLGRWDQLSILQNTYYECGACKGRIDESRRPALVSAALWLPTAHGTPGIVSQHINDLYSSDANSTWGVIVLEYLQAKREGRRELQGFYNHRLGLPWSDDAQNTDISDIRNNIAGRPGDKCPPYKRGNIPFIPSVIILGSDVGGNYVKWSIQAVLPNMVDAAVIDWGEDLEPDAIAELIINQTWLCAVDGKRYRISFGFMDAKFRKTEAYRACLAVPGQRLIPTAGLGGAAARSTRLFAYVQIANYTRRLKRLDYNDRELKDEVYIECLKKKKRRIFLPIDVESDAEFVGELCAESLEEDEHGATNWNPHPPANHYGDTVKEGTLGLRFLTRSTQNVTEPAPAV